MTSSKMTKWFPLDKFYPEKVGTYYIRTRPVRGKVLSGWWFTRYWDGSVWRIAEGEEVSNVMMQRGGFQWRGFKTEQFLPDEAVEVSWY